MDDSARKKPQARPGVESRVSGVKSIVKPRSTADRGPTMTEILASLQQARAEAAGFVTDDRILQSYVHALERLYPQARFAIRLVLRPIPGSSILQATTHRMSPEAIDEVSLTEAGFLRAGLGQPTTAPSGISLRRTYEPFLIAASEEQLSPMDGLDAPLVIDGQVVGVLAAEFERSALPARLEDTVLVAAAEVSATIESAHLRRESHHLRDYLEKLLEHANIPVLVADRDRSIRVVSGAFERITGLHRKELESTDFLKLAGQSDRVRMLAAFVHALRGRQGSPFELRLPKAGGGQARLQLTLAPILDSEGRVAGVIAIGQDRTEVRELEGQVIHADKLATLGQLAAGIVHEINNPLTSISVYGEHLLGKLRRTGAEDNDVKRVERILRSADRILSFTRNLLTYARPSREEAQLVSVSEVLDEAIVFCEHIIREANMKVVRTYGHDLPQVNAVPGQLHQIFVNLITNACNAAHDDGGEVRLSSRRCGHERIEIRIDDDGVGMAQGELDRVFEPFFSTRRKGKGTGLGLSIVKNLVEQHRGTIEIKSELGKGTTVVITLPCSGQ